MPQTELFADVILPLSLPQLYTYQITNEYIDTVEIGKRVIIQFGKQKIYSAIVFKIHSEKPQGYEIKEILEVLDDVPVVNQIQLKFWEWIASYYMCTLGEVYKAALPSALKLESETMLALQNEDETREQPLDKDEFALYQEIKQQKKTSIKDIKSLKAGAKLMQITKSLLQKGIIKVEEELLEGYKPKYETYVKLTDELYSEVKLHEAFNQLTSAPKQLQILMTFVQMSGFLNEANAKEVSKKELLEKAFSTQATFKSLTDKNIFETYKKEVDRLHTADATPLQPHALNEPQQKALNEINNKFAEKNVLLLHGITSSGKTEIYIHLIQQFLAQGKQVLYLLPEIAITSQIINRLRRIFGKKVGVYHSKFNDAERVEIWYNVIRQNNEKPDDETQLQVNDYQIILGVRSSVFLPFSNLGLIIVDEEHENTFKQFDPAPRYHARDAAIVLATMHKAKVLLGTATPAIETYFNAQNGKYGLVKLDSRYKNIQLPEIILADLKEARKRKEMKSHFTPLLLSTMEEALTNGEQVILFQNRRGFSPFVECHTCGWVPKCEHCDCSLTYHKFNNQLICHYCGYTINNTPLCLACGDAAMQTIGFGTEKIEDEIPIFFPKAKVARMDLDTTRSKLAYQSIIQEFENGQIDILIGTQMVTKGLDFGNVSVVGILNADTMLNFPDFRAFERSYQLMAQVSGRAGRKTKRGKVIIQTSNPEHPIVTNVIANDYIDMYNREMTERQQFKYPPFHRLILINLKHKQQDVLDIAAEQFATLLRKIFAQRVLGPEYPPVNRIQNWFQKTIMLKIEKEKSVERAKQLLNNQILKMKPAYSGLQIVVNVDPV